METQKTELPTFANLLPLAVAVVEKAIENEGLYQSAWEWKAIVKFENGEFKIYSPYRGRYTDENAYDAATSLQALWYLEAIVWKGN